MTVCRFGESLVAILVFGRSKVPGQAAFSAIMSSADSGLFPVNDWHRVCRHFEIDDSRQLGTAPSRCERQNDPDLCRSVASTQY